MSEPERRANLPRGVGEPAGERLPAWGVVALLLLIVLSFGLRMYGLNAVSLRGDEAFSVVFARQDLGEVWRGLLLYETQPPLYYTLLHYWMAAAGQSELAVRFVSVFFGLITIAITYRLARSLGAEERAVRVAAILVALNPYLLWQSQDARMYTLLAATCAASLLLALLVWRSLLAEGQAPRRLWLGYLAVTILSLYAHYGAIFALAAQNLALIVWLVLRPAKPAGFWSSPAMRKWLLGQAIVLAGFLPWMAAAASMMLGHTKDWIAAVTLPELLERSLITFTVGTTAGDLAAPLAAACAVALAAGAWHGLRARTPEAAGLLVYLVAPLLTAFLVSLARPMFDERYFIFVLPAFCLTLAWLVAGSTDRVAPTIRGRDPAPLVGLTVVALVCAASLYSIGNYFTQPQYAKSPGWRELVQYVIRSAQPGDVVIQNYPDPTLSYYLDSRLPLRVIPSAAPVQQAPTDRLLEQATTEARRIWFLPYESADWDADGYVEQWLRQHAAFASAARPGGMDLELYLVQAP